MSHANSGEILAKTFEKSFSSVEIKRASESSLN